MTAYRFQALPDEHVAGTSVPVLRGHLIYTLPDGRRCALYTVLARPASRGPVPLVMHAPGGGQTVAAFDLEFWVRAGFACVSFDWQQGLCDHDPARKSHWPAGVMEQGRPFTEWGQFIIPLVIAGLGHLLDWAATVPGIDGTRVGMTGISWGGYLTWVANAKLPRFRAVVPVYGCGGLFDPLHPHRPSLPASMARRWQREWDPLALAARQHAPVCWLNAANDFFSYPRWGDALCDQLWIDHRRLLAPNLDHAVPAEASALAVAWMRQHLTDGPAVPAEPRFHRGRLQVAARERTVGIDQWWSPAAEDDDRRCWHPGEPPAGAAARLAIVRYQDGIALSTGVARLRPRQRLATLGTTWPDLRAGLGWRWELGGTQLHGNAVELTPIDGSWQRLRVRAPAGRQSSGVLLRQLADPRWRGRSLTLAVADAAGRPLTGTLQIGARLAPSRGKRKECGGPVPVRRGRITLSPRTCPFVPRGQWRNLVFLLVNGLPPEVVLGPLTAKD